MDKDDSLKYEWNLIPNEVQSSDRNPSFIFENPGIYNVSLTDNG